MPEPTHDPIRATARPGEMVTHEGPHGGKIYTIVCPHCGRQQSSYQAGAQPCICGRLLNPQG